MADSGKSKLIKPGITARGFLTAVKDYKEPAVIEELAANSYDADASTVLILLDTQKQQLHVIDDGLGFTRGAIEKAAVLGGGDKSEADYSYGKRPYLGAYGFGLKSTIKIANKVTIHSISQDGEFTLEIDWKRLEEALAHDGRGFQLDEAQVRSPTGTHIVLDLKNPTGDLLDAYHRVLGNLPDDNGGCRYYTGLFHKVKREIGPVFTKFSKLKTTCRTLAKSRQLMRVVPSDDLDLKHCQIIDTADKQDNTVKCRIYFAGMDGGKVRPIKKGLRGIYVRIQGRLLKQSFDDQKYVYAISKWVKFASGIRVELTIDWLRNEISLSREGLTFSNPKLEEQFRGALSRNISAFIGPQLKKLQRKTESHGARKHLQRMELARSRVKNAARLAGVGNGFAFKPETDGELALLVANEVVLKRVNTAYRLLDYNDQAPVDCAIYDLEKREIVMCELEPTLMEFLGQNHIPEDLKLIITWSLGKWRMGAKKKGSRATFQLREPERKKKGHYRLLSFARENARTPTRDFEVVVLEELFEAD